MEECANRSNDFCQPLRKYGDLGRGQKTDLSNNYSFLNLLKMSFTYSYSGSLQTRYPLWSTVRLSVLQFDTPLRVPPYPPLIISVCLNPEKPSPVPIISESRFRRWGEGVGYVTGDI